MCMLICRLNRKRRSFVRKTIYGFHVMITQLLENTKKKKSLRCSKKKQTPTLSKSSEEEEKEDSLHIEISSK